MQQTDSAERDTVYMLPQLLAHVLKWPILKNVEHFWSIVMS